MLKYTSKGPSPERKYGNFRFPGKLDFPYFRSSPEVFGRLSSCFRRAAAQSKWFAPRLQAAPHFAFACCAEGSPFNFALLCALAWAESLATILFPLLDHIAWDAVSHIQFFACLFWFSARILFHMVVAVSHIDSFFLTCLKCRRSLAFCICFAFRMGFVESACFRICCAKWSTSFWKSIVQECFAPLVCYSAHCSKFCVTLVVKNRQISEFS